jgi:hypothetical protein
MAQDPAGPEARDAAADQWRDEPVALADYADPLPAERLAVRLRAEHIGAAVWPVQRAAPLLPDDAPPLGPTVVVRRVDHARALRLAGLFAEVDAGVCALAPPPRDLWHGPSYRPLFAAAVLMALAFAMAVVLVAAYAV